MREKREEKKTENHLGLNKPKAECMVRREEEEKK